MLISRDPTYYLIICNQTNSRKAVGGLQVPRSACNFVVPAVNIVALGLLCLCVGCGQDRPADAKLSTTGTHRVETASMTTREFAIEGMMCQGCADSITSAIA